MADEFPSNSQNSRAAKNTPGVREIESKKVARITKTEAVVRKKPLGKRFKETFFGGDARGALGFVIGGVLIPAAKDMIADAGQEMVQRMIFGESRGGYRPRGWSPAGTPGHVRYNGMSQSSSTPPWRRDHQDSRQVSRQGRAQHNFDEIILDSRGEAEQVVDTLMDIVGQYNQATVADLYEMVGITSAYTDQKYGWTDLRGAGVQHIRGGQYLLNLPKPVALD